MKLQTSVNIIGSIQKSEQDIGIVCYEIANGHGNAREFFEPGLIILIVILNAVMGVAQESKAEKALDALKNMSAPHARVIRDGEEKIIDAAELVPGDIIKLEAKGRFMILTTSSA